MGCCMSNIHGPVSQTREPPNPGTEGPQQAMASNSRFLRFPPPHLFYVSVTPLVDIFFFKSRNSYNYSSFFH